MLQNGTNLSHLALGLDSRIRLRPTIKLHINIVLDLAGARSRVLAEGLGGELDIEGSLHDFGEGVGAAGASTGLESGEEGGA